MTSFCSLGRGIATACWVPPLACSRPPRRSSDRRPRRSPLHRILSLFPRKRPRPRPLSPPSPPRPSAQEWRDLILEFESRADSKYTPTSPPPRGRLGRLNPAQFKSLPYVSCASMAAFTITLWYFGRILRLDAFVLLLYPLPTMYAAARWGLRYADLTLASSTFLIFTIMGPLYAGLFFLNTGLLTIAYSRALWYRAGWRLTLLAGAVAKGVGLALQLAWISVIMQYDAWKAAAVQVSVMLGIMGGVVNRMAGRVVWGKPGLGAVQAGLAVLVTLHSLYHVMFTLLTIAILLKKMGARLEREPPDVPGVKWFLRKTTPREERYR